MIPGGWVAHPQAGRGLHPSLVTTPYARDRPVLKDGEAQRVARPYR